MSSSLSSPAPSSSGFDTMSTTLPLMTGGTATPPPRGDLHKTVLRLKRRLDESPSPSKVLVMSYKRCKFAMDPTDSTTTFGDENHSNEEVCRVFHLAGTVDKDEVDDDKSIAKTIKEALDVVDKTKALSFQKARDSNRCYKQRKSFRVVDKTKEDVKQSAVDNRFKVISQRRGLPNLETASFGESSSSPADEQKEYEHTLLFNLLDLVAEDAGPSEKKARSGADPRGIGSITINGVPMVKTGNNNGLTEVDSPNSGVVFDLYVAKDPMSEDHFQNQSVSVRPADGDYEFDFDNCVNSDEELRPDDDEDSNDEDNWRNDYPDSDPDNEAKEGFAYGYEGPDEDIADRFASFNFQGNDLSTDDEGEFVYSTNYDGCDDGLGGMYTRYKSRLRREELADEVVTSESDNDE